MTILIRNTVGDVILEHVGSLVGGNFSDLDLRYAVFTDQNLEGLCFDGADLQDAVLVNTDLYWARCFKTNLNGADLRGADLRGADLTCSSLRNARLENANLGIDEVGGETELEGADLTGALIDGANFCGAVYSATTQLPEGFDPAQHGMRMK